MYRSSFFLGGDGGEGVGGGDNKYLQNQSFFQCRRIKLKRIILYDLPACYKKAKIFAFATDLIPIYAASLITFLLC